MLKIKAVADRPEVREEEVARTLNVKLYLRVFISFRDIYKKTFRICVDLLRLNAFQLILVWRSESATCR